MSALLHHHRHGIRWHLRPKPRRPIVTDADLDPEMLRLYPGLADELNTIIADVWAGEGKPTHGWEGWTHAEVPLDDAIALPCLGEA